MPEKLNKHAKANWKKVSWEVQAQNNSLFADAYVADYVFNRFRDEEAKLLLDSSLKQVRPLMVDFCLKKLVKELDDYESEVWTNTELGRKLLEDAKNGDLDALERFYQEDTDRRAGNPWDYVFSDDNPAEGFTTNPFGGPKYLDLVFRVRRFLADTNVVNLDALVNWLHNTGSLFDSYGVKEFLPLTQELANILSSAPKMRDVAKYASEKGKALWEKYYEGVIFNESREATR